MRKVCRVTDTHTCGSVNTSGSPNVFVNGLPIHRIGDSQSHGGTQAEGSTTVFANGLGIARTGDFTKGEPPPPFQHSDNPESGGSPNVFTS